MLNDEINSSSNIKLYEYIEKNVRVYIIFFLSRERVKIRILL